MTVLPLIALIAGQITGVLLLNNTVLWLLGAGLWLLDFFLIRRAGRYLDRINSLPPWLHRPERKTGVQLREKELIKTALAGGKRGEEALAALLQANYRLVLGYFLKVTQDPELARDLTQKLWSGP